MEQKSKDLDCPLKNFKNIDSHQTNSSLLTKVVAKDSSTVKRPV
jgi:hypothetical protein